MRLIKRNQINKVDNSADNHIDEYLHLDPDINLAIATCSNRYPATDYVVNQISKELVYVMEGSIQLITPDNKILLELGDSIIIEANEPFAWLGTAKILTVCTPSWTPAQHVTYSLP